MMTGSPQTEQPLSIYDEIRAERERAHAKHGATSMEVAPVDEMYRAVILGEEVGEVAEEVLLALLALLLTSLTGRLQQTMNDGRVTAQELADQTDRARADERLRIAACIERLKLRSDDQRDYDDGLTSALEAIAAVSADDESHCRRCGGKNCTWAAPSPLWNEVMRGGDIDGEWQWNEIICPSCFAELAEAAGVASLWRFYAVRVNVPLATVTPSGRVWDEAAWLWRSPSPAADSPVGGVS